jgi:fructose-1,6-bisphosphatase/inositol monophosphatase family enzyme
MKSNEDRIAEVAETAARKAGEILRSHADRQLKVAASTRHDFKLEVDVLSERAILEVISSAFPEHAILAEESGTAEGAGDYLWIIDPLDGTVNFYYGLPYYCVSIACFARPGGQPSHTARGIESLGRPVVGIVYAPPADDLFIGRVGQGATLNGRPIRTGGVKELKDAVLCMGFGKSDELGMHMAKMSVQLADKVKKLRCLGAAAYDMANVACGRLSGFYEKSIRTWDIAGAYIILKEAGGILDADEFEPTRWNILACAPGIHGQMKSILANIS